MPPTMLTTSSSPASWNSLPRFFLTDSSCDPVHVQISNCQYCITHHLPPTTPHLPTTPLMAEAAVHRPIPLLMIELHPLPPSPNPRFQESCINGFLPPTCTHPPWRWWRRRIVCRRWRWWWCGNVPSLPLQI